MSGDAPPGPFSLGQAEMVQSRKTCPYCGHKRGDIHPIIRRPWCADQFLAGEIIAWHRRVAEKAAFRKASEALA